MVEVHGGLLFWSVITFLLLLVVLKKVAWGPIISALESREDEIKSALNAAEKAREEAEKVLNTAATIVKESTGIVPVLHTREGEIISELKKLIAEEEGINVLVLAANTNENEKNPGPIINALISREISTLRIPVMIVPGNFSKDHISQIT